MALAGFALSELREFGAEVLVKPFCFQAVLCKAGGLLCSPQMVPQRFGVGNRQVQPQCLAGPGLEMGLWAALPGCCGSCGFTFVLFMVQEALGWISPWLRMISDQGLTWSVRKYSPME